MTKAKWNVDKVHSTIGFSIKHMMISNVKGTFNEFEADIVADPTDLTDAEIEFNIDASSLDTKVKDRDDHLRSGDFFDVENHPNMTFKATEITKKSDDNYDITGDYTIRGTTNTVTNNVTYESGAKGSMSGDEDAGCRGSTSISREDFGITWNAALETSGFVVSHKVKINIEIQLRK